MSSLRAVTIIAFFAATLCSSAIAQESRSELKNDVTIELLGRCLLYSMSYQGLVSHNFGLELGLSILGGSNSSVTFLTGGGRLYLSRRNAAPCIGFGVVFLTAPSSSGPFGRDNSTSYAYVGPGFEYRSTGGFLFRGTIYFLIRDGFVVWPGAQLGVAF